VSIEERSFIVENHSSFWILLEACLIRSVVIVGFGQRIELVRDSARAVMVSLLVSYGVCASSWAILSSCVT
jgi:hypothetical protein